ncbi:MAG TPA: EamA family transporter [Pyrinomonadaceae bacterium]|jgi:drug/metabolite transporter (DMT)-like permease
MNKGTLHIARPVMVWILLCGIWGSTWAFIKIGLRDLPPLTFASVRFIIAIILLLLVAYFRRAHWPRTRAEWQLLMTTGILAFTFNYGLIFWGEQYISSGLAALLQATIPLFGLLIAHKYLPDEPLTFMRLTGVALGLVGVGIIFSNQLEMGNVWSFWGSAAIITGALAAAYSNVLVKAHGAKFDITVLVVGQMICGFVPLLIISIVKEGNPLSLHWTLAAVVSVFYLALVGTVAAFMLYYWLVRHMNVTNTQLIALVTPVVAVLLGVLFLDEELTWRVALGGLGIFTGIGLVIFRRRKPQVELQETPGG